MTCGVRKILVSMVLICGVASVPATADCVYNGQVYPEGYVLGNMVCSGGQWRPR